MRSLGTWTRAQITRLSSLATKHPLLTIAAIGLVVAIGEGWWILATRPLGSFDIDESGYLASALRFHRNLLIGPKALASVVGSTENGPLTPLLAVPFLLIGPRTATTAMFVQPALQILCAVAVGGITLRLANPHAALVAGTATIAFPAALVSTHSFQFGLATGASLALAVWALLASDRGRRTWPMIGFGAAVGLMLLARTMTVGFLPALFVACVLQLVRERRSFANLAAASITATVIAAPWWWIAWPWISSYLLRNGYGNRSQYWGQTSLVGRFNGRLDFLVRDFKPMFLGLGILVLIVATFSCLDWRRSGRSLRSWPAISRDSVTLFSIVAFGYAALMSTSNAGSWFDLPIELLMIAGIVALASTIPAPQRSGSVVASVCVALALVMGLSVMQVGANAWIAVVTAGALVGVGFLTARGLPRGPHAGSWSTRMGAATLVLSMVTVVASANDTGGFVRDRDSLSFRTLLVGGVADLQAGNFEADARLQTMNRSIRRSVSGQWWRSNSAVVDLLQRYVDRYGEVVATVSGSGHLMSINTILLASEIKSQGFTAFDVPDTTATEAEILTHLTPSADDAHAGESRGVHEFSERTRIVILIKGKSLKFPDDRQGQRFERIAVSQGWRAFESTPIPDGGEVTFFDLETRRTR